MAYAIDELLELGFTQKQIGLGCGVTRQTIGRFMNGETISAVIHKKASSLLEHVVNNNDFVTCPAHNDGLNDRLERFGKVS